ncbi:MAG: polysaccharide biosynthesis protein [Desulfatibacillum sp.]|nr:polysaccharide biosynthesis protein [Desulfatibacillum sp.]
MRRNNLWLILGIDMLLIVLAHYLAYIARFDGIVLRKEWANFFFVLTWLVPVKVLCLSYFDLYKGMWRYTGLYDLVNLVKACAVSSMTAILVILAVFKFQGFSRSVFLIDLFATLILLGGYRVGIRLFFMYTEGPMRRWTPGRRPRDLKKVLVIGAGAMGEKLVREIHENPSLHFDMVGLIDDDPSKRGHKIHGVPILSDLHNMHRVAEKFGVDEIIIAISRITAMDMRRIVNHCKVAGLPFKTMPGLGEVLEGRLTVSAIRQVRYEDLLGREPVELDLAKIEGYIRGKRVLVTGGAGSIGSELCKQIGGYAPRKLLIADRSESGLYDINLQIRDMYPHLETQELLCAVQNRELMDRLFALHRPEVVFHAAAYKHVPMMELHPWEAVFNNILGTRNILDLSSQYSVERCVVVSTDKAVRPTNVMGATKRVGEMLMKAFATRNGTRFMAVRFGNVVGSAGSVIPLFRKQIERRGPVTVTHPEVTRYFMTIPEACSLILQTGALGEGGEIFLLKMGTPIRIADMARDVITLHGFKPDVDIEIKYIGLRPGEKLYEELITAGEDVMETQHKDIMVLNSDHHRELVDMDASLKTLVKAALSCEGQAIKQLLKEMVPEYTPEN